MVLFDLDIESESCSTIIYMLSWKRYTYIEIKARKKHTPYNEDFPAKPSMSYIEADHA